MSLLFGVGVDGLKVDVGLAQFGLRGVVEVVPPHQHDAVEFVLAVRDQHPLQPVQVAALPALLDFAAVQVEEDVLLAGRDDAAAPRRVDAFNHHFGVVLEGGEVEAEAEAALADVERPFSCGDLLDVEHFYLLGHQGSDYRPGILVETTVDNFIAFLLPFLVVMLLGNEASLHVFVIAVDPDIGHSFVVDCSD